MLRKKKRLAFKPATAIHNIQVPSETESDFLRKPNKKKHSELNGKRKIRKGH